MENGKRQCAGRGMGKISMSRAARFSLLPRTLPLSLPRSPSAQLAGAHPRVARHPSLRRSRPCADQTNFTRLSPGVGCCFRALRSLARSPCPFPFLWSSQLLPLPPSTLPFSVYSSVFLFLLRSSAYGARRDFVAKFLESLTYSMLCTRHEICLNP